MGKTPDILEITAELEGLASICDIISDPFLEDDVRLPPKTIGTALFAVRKHMERIMRTLEVMENDNG